MVRTEEGGSWWFLQEKLGLLAISLLFCVWIFELLKAASSLFAIQLEANAHQQHCCYTAWGNCLLWLCPELALGWSEVNKKGWCRPVSPSIVCAVRTFHLRDTNKAANFNWSVAVYLWVLSLWWGLSVSLGWMYKHFFFLLFCCTWVFP